MKNLKVQIRSASSEVAKRKVFDAAGVSEENAAATVIRDSNGKVIEVSIALPDTAAEAARDALANNPGIAAFADMPPPPPIPGGLVAAYEANDTLRAEGWNEQSSGGVVTVENGLLKVSPDADDQGGVRGYKSRILGVGGIQNICKLRGRMIKPASPVGDLRVFVFTMDYDDRRIVAWFRRTNAGQLYTRLYVSLASGAMERTQSSLVAYDENVLHDMEIRANSTTVEAYFNGALLLSSTKIAPNSTFRGNLAAISLSAGLPGEIDAVAELDYFRVYQV